jgi:predicted dehydrogenase
VFQHRFGSGARRAAALVTSRALGRTTTAECRTLWYRPDSYFDPEWRGRWDTEGGGPTMGHGIHQMDLLLAVLGPWQEVTAVAARRARPTATEDLSAALVTFPDGTLATVVNSIVSPRETSDLRFDLERATVEVSHLYGYGDEDWTVTALAGFEEQAAAAWQAAGPGGRRSGHGAQLAAVLDALDEGTAPPVPLVQARVTMELVAGIYASAFTGRPVRRDELGGSPFYAAMDGGGQVWTDGGEPVRRVR